MNLIQIEVTTEPSVITPFIASFKLLQKFSQRDVSIILVSRCSWPKFALIFPAIIDAKSYASISMETMATNSDDVHRLRIQIFTSFHRNDPLQQQKGAANKRTRVAINADTSAEQTETCVQAKQ
jgi:hypothetical protein